MNSPVTDKIKALGFEISYEGIKKLPEEAQEVYDNTVSYLKILKK